MLIPIRQTVRLSAGSVTLRAYGANVADAHLLDLLTLSATLGHMRDDWTEYRRQDVEGPAWDAFWRLVNAALEPGSALPEPLTWNDRLTLLLALWELNDVEEVESKVEALGRRAQRLLTRMRTQGQTMTA